MAWAVLVVAGECRVLVIAVGLAQIASHDFAAAHNTFSAILRRYQEWLWGVVSGRVALTLVARPRGHCVKCAHTFIDGALVWVR